VKALGNYRFATRHERRPGTLVGYRGQRAMVRFHNGDTFAIPSEPLKAIGVASGELFMLVIIRRGKKIVDIRVEQFADPRPARQKAMTPKIMAKTNGRMITRK